MIILATLYYCLKTNKCPSSYSAQLYLYHAKNANEALDRKGKAHELLNLQKHWMPDGHHLGESIVSILMSVLHHAECDWICKVQRPGRRRTIERREGAQGSFLVCKKCWKPDRHNFGESIIEILISVLVHTEHDYIHTVPRLQQRHTTERRRHMAAFLICEETLDAWRTVFGGVSAPCVPQPQLLQGRPEQGLQPANPWQQLPLRHQGAAAAACRPRLQWTPGKGRRGHRRRW